MNNIMKLISKQTILLYLFMIGFCSSYAQTWSSIGNPNFTGASATPLSLAIDPSGIPYIAFIDYSTNQSGISVMSYTNNGWVQVGTPGFSNGTASSPAIAIDGNGIPYVVYIDGTTNGSLTVMAYINGTWQTVGNAGFTQNQAFYPSITVDGSGTPWVAFQDMGSANQGVTVMTFNGQSWTTVGTQGLSAGVAQYVTITVDNGGIPYVAYQDFGGNMQGTATVMTYVNGSWTPVGNAGISAGTANWPSITVDGNGTLYVAYQDGANNNMATVMTYSNGIWAPLGNPGFSVGQVQYTSIVMSGGIPYVVYQDASANNAATVMQYTADYGWVTAGSQGISPGVAGSPSLAAYGGTAYLGYADLTAASTATVLVWTGGVPTTLYSGSTCGILYFYDAAGNRIYRTDTCISNSPVSKATHGNIKNSDNSVVKNIPPNSMISGNGQTINSLSKSIIKANIYPNPTQNIVNITLSQPVQNAEITLLDINGTVLQKSVLNDATTSLDISQYASGSYMVTIKNDVVNFVFKILKM